MEQPSCPGCGYPLKHLLEPRCPECGLPFDPDSPGSYTRQENPAGIEPWTGRPVGWPTHALGFAAFLLTLISFSAPGLYVRLFICAVLLWILVGLVWMVRLILMSRVTRRDGAVYEPGRIRTGPWLVLPCLAMLCVVLCYADLPFRVAFWISRPAIEQLSRQAASLPPRTALPDRWIGVYPATSIQAIPNGVQFLVRGAGFLDKFGIAHSAAGRPSSSDEYRLFQGSHWYIYVRPLSF